MTRKFHLLTYGCQMNEFDSQVIRQLLLQHGYFETAEKEEADYFILNTCSIRENAVRRIEGRINELQRYREFNPQLKIAVGGCVTQLEGESFAKKVAGIDLVFGASNFYRLPEFFSLLTHSSAPLICLDDSSAAIPPDLPTDLHSSAPAFLAIMRGCNNYCSYCVVPYTRGREVSRPATLIIEQLKTLHSNGCQDVTLVGQNVNSYCDGDVDFPALLKMAAQTGIPRLRFITSHPKDMTKEVIDMVASFPNLCNRFHLPLQSGSDAILKKMNRHYDKQKYLAIAHYIRETIPPALITTDIIVGFPTETEDDFQQTLDLMDEVQFDASYMFKYSPRPGTKATRAVDDVAAEEKQRRLELVMAKQKELSLKQNQRFLNKTVSVLVEGRSKKRAAELMGRTEQSLVVIFPGKKDWQGEFIHVRITDVFANTLKGEVVFG